MLDSVGARYGGGVGEGLVSFPFPLFSEPVAANRTITAQLGCDTWGGQRGERARGGRATVRFILGVQVQ